MIADEHGVHIFAGFEGVTLEQDLKGLIENFRIGGIVLFKRNIQSAEQLKDLVAAAQQFALHELGRPLLVAIDQEGGSVQRLAPYFTTLPSARSLADDGPGAVARWARIAAADLKEIGVHINFAPVLDIVAEGPEHFMSSRSLGSTPETVSELGRIWVQTLQESGISATAKHFPGLGRAGLDPHHFTPVIREDDPEKFREDILPFQAAVDAGVHCIMTSHALYPAIDPGRPATLSREINHRLLRETMGFEGILFGDDLDMAAIRENYTPHQVAGWGMECGTDFFLLCQKSGNIGPFYRVLSGLIKEDASLRRAHLKSLERIARLFEFHFAQGFVVPL